MNIRRFSGLVFTLVCFGLRAEVLDVSNDYSTNTNPNAIWSYGYKPTLSGTFTPLQYSLIQNYGPQSVVHRWLKTSAGGPPSINKNIGTNNHASVEGQFDIAPGVVWFGPGSGSDDAYGVIRCVIPSAGRYRLRTAVRTYIQGPLSGDCDFHVVKNGTELFGQFLGGSSSASYSNVLLLTAGDIVDFAVGRGADNSSYASGLEIRATLTPVDTPPPAEDCAPISPRGLVSWWRGEGSAEDSAGSNHGQLVNGVGFAMGKVGQGFLLNGNNYILVPDHPSLDLTEEITMEMWFKSETWGEGRTWALMDKRTWSDCNYGAVVSVPWGFQLYYNDPSIWGGDHPGNMFEISSYYPLPTVGVFHHFAGTFRQVDASHIELKTYLDGALVQTRVFSGNLANTANNIALAIGSARGGADGGAWKGILDEVSLYSRALSAEEVRAIYDAGSAGKCPITLPPPPTFVLNLEEDYSTNINPGAVWSYGWKPSLDGAFTTLPVSLLQNYGPGVLIHRWIKTPVGGPPSVNKHVGTATHNDGQGVYPPGVVWFGPGDGNERFGVIRCIIPAAGTYRLQTAVRTYLEGPLSGDCDFHVVKNGVELFEQFLPGTSGTSYSNTLALAAGDIIDFAVGRGADDSSYASGLKIQAVLVLLEGDPPPPPPGCGFDMAADFSTNANPGGAWSYGYVTTLGGPFSTYNLARFSYGDNAVPAFSWSKNSFEAGAVYFNPSYTETVVANLGRGVFPPRTIWFYPGDQAHHPDQFAVIRLTIPTGYGGRYVLESAVQSILNDDLSRDADFHILKNGIEIFAHNLPPRSSATYSNEVVVNAGDTIDFVAGRGPDGIQDGSGLKIRATLRCATEPPRLSECAPISGSGLVAWWRGEGNGNDSVGSNDGQLINGVSFAPGKVGQGFLLNGNNYILVPDHPSLDLTREITLEMWFKSDTWGEGRTWALMDKRTWSDCNYGAVVSEPWGFQLYYNDPNIWGGDHPGNMFEISSYYPLPTIGVFHHFAGTFRQVDSSHIELRTYLDGELVQTRLFVGNLANTVNDVALAIGSARGGADGGAFRGIIDEVSLYNRALSAEEVRAIYQADSAGKCLVPTAQIALSPRLDMPGVPHALVVACDGQGANVVLDGTGSTDPDGDTLSYAWFAGASQQSFSTEAVVRTAADVGLHTVRLRVSDGQSSAEASLTFEVVPPAEAAAHLGLLLDAADLSHKHKSPLEASLNAAIRALENGKFRQAINQLEAFDNKVHAQLAREFPALAEQLSAATRSLIDALEECPEE